MLKFFDVENKFRAGSLMLKRTSSVLLMTSFVLLCLMMMKTNQNIDAEEDSFLDAGNKFCDGVSTDDDDQFNDNEDQ